MLFMIYRKTGLEVAESLEDRKIFHLLPLLFVQDRGLGPYTFHDVSEDRAENCTVFGRWEFFYLLALLLVGGKTGDRVPALSMIYRKIGLEVAESLGYMKMFHLLVMLLV